MTYAFRRYTLHMTSKTNINNGYTRVAIKIIPFHLFSDFVQFTAFRDRKN